MGKKPRPIVNAKPPVDPPSSREYMGKVRLTYDLAHLAFATDSTRQWWKGCAGTSSRRLPPGEAPAAALREELRSDVTRLLRRVEGLEQDVYQWRRSYWQVVDEREALSSRTGCSAHGQPD